MRRRKTAIFFLVLGICLIVLAVALNVGWILLNLTEVALLILGIVFFALIITGLILNTIFLFREIRRNEQHDAFLNSVTHELKTPIASIKLYLETLRSRDVASEKRLEFYDIMLADSNRLLSTVEQVLQASSTRESKRMMNISDVDVGRLLEETIEITSKRHHIPENAITFFDSEERITVTGDFAELQTAFANLLDNAVKYSRESPEITVKLGALSSLRSEVAITDSGVGILPGDLKRIFKRFYRVQSAFGPKGTGLGLFIVREIVKKHGGKIEAESDGDGKGSTFRIQLPRS
ncbi:MAG: HAMP domain-containing sensor histidine kinase [Pyrinomonadaceae bacterium]